MRRARIGREPGPARFRRGVEPQQGDIERARLSFDHGRGFFAAAEFHIEALAFREIAGGQDMSGGVENNAVSGRADFDRRPQCLFANPGGLGFRRSARRRGQGAPRYCAYAVQMRVDGICGPLHARLIDAQAGHADELPGFIQQCAAF